MNHPAPPLAINPSDSPSPITWFGASRRTIGGQPDSRYGWWVTAQGPCIVKAMDPVLAAYNQTLLDHERRMLERLQSLGAPVPALLDAGRTDWLVTRFAGLSLQRLQQDNPLNGHAALSHFALEERLSVWIHLLRRLQPLADSGVLVIDLYDANVVVPLTEGTRGQLRLHEPALIDHAHTLEAGMGMRRPVWLNRRMDRIAPELREALAQDQQALEHHFANVGAALPGYSQLAHEHDAHSRRMWAEYDAPQALQQLLDAGQMSPDHAMQFAAASAISGMLRRTAHGTLHTALQQVLQKMTDPTAARRYASLTDAAQALAEARASWPLVSQRRYPELRPQDLMADPQAPATQAPAATSHGAQTGCDDATFCPANEASLMPDLIEATAVGARARLNPVWIYAAAALGAVLGTLWPPIW